MQALESGDGPNPDIPVSVLKQRAHIIARKTVTVGERLYQIAGFTTKPMQAATCHPQAVVAVHHDGNKVRNSGIFNPLETFPIESEEVVAISRVQFPERVAVQHLYVWQPILGIYFAAI